ncbi:MAG: hypothetical protein K0S23_425 [Fluviicola sp.]|jgi:hypothetical protein|nr:hypothetical protein [Fluviicola sp.]
MYLLWYNPQIQEEGLATIQKKSFVGPSVLRG